MSRLSGKVAIVTGGASGFGLGITKKFVAEGANVLVLDINEQSGQNLLEIFHDSKQVKFLKADVTKESDWKQAVELAVSDWHKLDVVVNNAGTTYPNKPSLTVTEQDFDKVFAVNVKSVYHSFNVVIPHFIEQGTGGSFIQISSTAALRPRPGLTWYNATKGAVSIASKSMAVEYGPNNIRFNCVCPVAGETPLLASFMGEDTPEKRAAFKATIPLGRFSQPSDIANSVAFLASDEAAFLTGLDLEVDGGRCI
ncbi:Sps19p [Sugiyamaella lignohabitans]|uniref:Sps19p n=1 Tax=Sugiyamaella lignohabitans TaxID=796027 RepID=A0A167E5D6_9ASCO|nr:Sps19p [Sugiyamaella lignohabitans]ANB13659.1 Sps19p [Sugiyamaella lignohabitans]